MGPLHNGPLIYVHRIAFNPPPLKEQNFKQTVIRTSDDTVSSPEGSSSSSSSSSKTATDEDSSKPRRPLRKRNFCILCSRLVAKFSDHVERRHADSAVGRQLKSVPGAGRERRALKMKITDSLRKKWNAVYNRRVEDSKQDPVFALPGGRMTPITVKKRSKCGKVPNVQCLHCEGLYRRDRLSTHIKCCGAYIESCKKVRPDMQVAALRDHSTNSLPSLAFVTDSFKKEILKNVIMDEVMDVAVHDPLIMKFGSEFHMSRRSPSDKNYILREIRDVSRLFVRMRRTKPELKTFHDILNPAHFETLCQAALEMAKYDPKTGNVLVPSIAYRLSQPLKELAVIARAEAVSAIYAHGTRERTSVTMLDDFLDLMKRKWKSKIGRVCTKAQKKVRVNRMERIALEGDIIKLAGHIEGRYRAAVRELKRLDDKRKPFDLLVHMIVVHAMLLIRRRPIDFKHASLQHYSNIDRHDKLIDMANGFELTEENLKDCKRFHIFYVPGKNLEIVPIVLTPIMKEVFDTVIQFRADVGISDDSLFSLAGGKPINPTISLKIIKEQVKHLKKPKDLTGNGLRHQAATFSRLKSSHPQYQDYLASTLGHTLAVHKKHYDLPLGILQKIMVCPVLNNIMTGSGERGGCEGNEVGDKTPVLVPESTETETGVITDTLPCPTDDELQQCTNEESPPYATDEEPQRCADEKLQPYATDEEPQRCADEKLQPCATDEKPQRCTDEELPPCATDEDPQRCTDEELPLCVTEEEPQRCTDEELPPCATDEESQRCTDEELPPCTNNELLPSPTTTTNDTLTSSFLLVKVDEPDVCGRSEHHDDRETHLPEIAPIPRTDNTNVAAPSSSSVPLTTNADAASTDPSTVRSGKGEVRRKKTKKRTEPTVKETNSDSLTRSTSPPTDTTDAKEGATIVCTAETGGRGKSTKSRKRKEWPRWNEEDMNVGSQFPTSPPADLTDDTTTTAVIVTSNTTTTADCLDVSSESSLSSVSFSVTDEDHDRRPSTEDIKCKRISWTEAEQDAVLDKFGKQLMKKIAPIRSEIVAFMEKTNKTRDVLKKRTVTQVHNFARNLALRKQRNVTPTIMRSLERRKARAGQKGFSKV